jgi:hypothetical protein
MNCTVTPRTAFCLPLRNHGTFWSDWRYPRLQSKPPTGLPILCPIREPYQFFFNIEFELFQTKSPNSVTTELRSQSTVALPQHFLYFFPEPQGHRSFRPTLVAVRRGSGEWLPASASRSDRKYW